MPNFLHSPPVPSDHLLLILPFTQTTLLNPSTFIPPLLELVVDYSLKSIVVYFSSPKDHEQLYSRLENNARDSWSTFQHFLGVVYSALAAAQWQCGKVLLNVEVHFDGEHGSIQEKMEEDVVAVVLEGGPLKFQAALWLILFAKARSMYFDLQHC
jgi:hypothetical protein